jgi:hypothetical protein
MRLKGARRVGKKLKPFAKGFVFFFVFIFREFKLRMNMKYHRNVFNLAANGRRFKLLGS